MTQTADGHSEVQPLPPARILKQATVLIASGRFEFELLNSAEVVLFLVVGLFIFLICLDFCFVLAK